MISRFLCFCMILGFTHVLNAQRSWLVEIDSVLQRAVEDEWVSGAVVLISQQGQPVMKNAYGYAELYNYQGKRLAKPVAMTLSHLFDLASLTKVFATTFGIMMLVEKSEIDLDRPVHAYLPMFRGPAKDSITIRHLLTHSAGLFEWKPLYYHARTAEASLDYLAQLPLAYSVGRERHYSDLGFMLLGYIIEAVTGQSLDRYLESNLYNPLGLRRTSFNPTKEGSAFAATSRGNPFEKRMVADDHFGFVCDEDPASFEEWRDYVLVGEVNDGNAFYANKGVAGHAGLFSTVNDLQILMDMLLNKGQYNGEPFIGERVVRTFLTKDQFGHGLGWAMSSPTIPVDNLPAESFGHTGFTGTFAIAIPDLKLSVIILTNRQNVGVDASGQYHSLTALRKKVTELAIEGIRK